MARSEDYREALPEVHWRPGQRQDDAAIASEEAMIPHARRSPGVPGQRPGRRHPSQPAGRDLYALGGFLEARTMPGPRYPQPPARRLCDRERLQGGPLEARTVPRTTPSIASQEVVIENYGSKRWPTGGQDSARTRITASQEAVLENTTQGWPLWKALTWRIWLFSR